MLTTLTVLGTLLTIIAAIAKLAFGYAQMDSKSRRRLARMMTSLRAFGTEHGRRIGRVLLLTVALLLSLGMVALSGWKIFEFLTDTGPIRRFELLLFLACLLNVTAYSTLSGTFAILLFRKKQLKKEGSAGLVITRRPGEALRLSIAPGTDSAELVRKLREDGILISFGEMHGKQVKVGVVAPAEIRIARDELTAEENS